MTPRTRACNTKGCDRKANIDANGTHHAYCPTCENQVLTEMMNPRRKELSK